MEDFVIVSKDNEREFISKAKELGWTSIVLLYKYEKGIKLKKFSEDFVKTGIYLDSDTKSDFSSFEIVVALGTKFSSLPRGVTHVVMNEFEVEKDFIHQRRGGLNHVFLNEFKGKILFAFSELQDNVKQDIILGRMMQNLTICNGDFVSLADDANKMRFVGDVSALKRCLIKKKF